MSEPAPAEPAGVPGRSRRPGAENLPGIHEAHFKFPPGFLWGAATSSHQVEGNCTNNDWWAWEEAGRVPERSGLACDHYHRFREDFDLARELGHNAHRFSLEWSRIEPEEGEWSTVALDHYRSVFHRGVSGAVDQRSTDDGQCRFVRRAGPVHHSCKFVRAIGSRAGQQCRHRRFKARPNRMYGIQSSTKRDYCDKLLRSIQPQPLASPDDACHGVALEIDVFFAELYVVHTAMLHPYFASE